MSRVGLAICAGLRGETDDMLICQDAAVCEYKTSDSIACTQFPCHNRDCLSIESAMLYLQTTMVPLTCIE
jgi:hypothetical protein